MAGMHRRRTFWGHDMSRPRNVVRLRCAYFHVTRRLLTLVALSMLLISGVASASDASAYLKPEQAFEYTTERVDDRIVVAWNIAPGYYLYRDRLQFRSLSERLSFDEPIWPAGELHEDEFFGEQLIYRGKVIITLPITSRGDRVDRSTTETAIPIEIKAQGCSDRGLCFPPVTWTANAGAPIEPMADTGRRDAIRALDRDTQTAAAPPRSEQARLTQLVSSGSWILVLSTFFGLGLLLSLTPCVLPMIPILMGIIVGASGGTSHRRGFALAMAYVQGMALTYAAAGALSVILLGQAPQAFFQAPWVVSAFAGLFVVLALAMMGVFTLQLPSRWQTRLTLVSNRQRSGTYIGTFVMGGLSALIVTACVAPAFVAALSVIGQSGQIIRGAAALYASGLGMGLPLLVVGTSAGVLLPRAGAWMEDVKVVFGILFLALAIYTIQVLLPPPAVMVAWSSLAIGSGVWGLSLRTKTQDPAPAVVRTPALMSLLYGAMLLIGAGAGGTDPLRPLAGWSAEQTTSIAAADELPFRIIKTDLDLQRELVAASASGRTVMLEFYADWCVSCKQMERHTYSDRKVRDALQPFVLLKADVTANDADDAAMLKRFTVYGPPAAMFFDRDGREIEPLRIVGFVNADAFQQHLLAVNRRL